MEEVEAAEENADVSSGEASSGFYSLFVKPEIFDFANCKDVDNEMFTSASGINQAKALSFCAGCAIRLDCLDYSLSENLKDMVFGGFTGKTIKKLHTALARHKLSVIPQLDPKTGPEIQKFALELAAFTAFINEFGRAPLRNEMYKFPARSRVPLFNGRMTFSISDFDLDLQKWLSDLYGENKYLALLFSFELAEIGVGYSKSAFNEMKYKYAFARWSRENSFASYIPIDAEIELVNGEIIYSRQNMPIVVQENEIIKLGRYFSSRVALSGKRNARGVALIDLKDIEAFYSPSIMRVTLESLFKENMDDANFEIFLKAFQIWKNRPKNIAKDRDLEFIEFTSTINLFLAGNDFSVDVMERLRELNRSVNIFFKVGAIANRIRTGSISISANQREILKDNDFIFDIDAYLLERDLLILKEWKKEFPKLQLTRIDVSKTYPMAKKITLPAGTLIAFGDETHTLMYSHDKNPARAFENINNALKLGLLNKTNRQLLEDLGFISDMKAFPLNVLEDLGVQILSASQLQKARVEKRQLKTFRIFPGTVVGGTRLMKPLYIKGNEVSFNPKTIGKKSTPKLFVRKRNIPAGVEIKHAPTIVKLARTPILKVEIPAIGSN